MSCYSQVIARWPHVVLPNVILVVVACASVAILVYPYPDLSNPIKGFEARGTPIKGREQVIYNLRELSKTVLTESPPRRFPQDVLDDPTVSALYKMFAGPIEEELRSVPGGTLPDWRSIPPEDGKTIRRPGRSRTSIYDANSTDPCLPGYVEDQPKVVFARGSEGSLLTPSAVQAMCILENRLLPAAGCRARHSIIYIMEQLNGKQCEQLNQEDIDSLLQHLRQCAPYYHSGQLNAECVMSGSCRSVSPSQCKQQEAMFNTLHYLSDDQFFAKSTEPNQTAYNETLTYALFSTQMHGNTFKEYYVNYVEGGVLKEGDVYVKAVDSLVKFELFEKFLMVDMVYFGLAMVLILIIMCCYLRSLVVTIATVLDVIFTLVLSYVVYRLVGIEHFPFMNILTGLVCIAIGADDVFIFFDTWQQVKKQNPNGSICDWMDKTFHHAALSIFVTSLTTASAFFANAVSEITDVKCFGIFSGIAILSNFLFMVTWVPSVIVFVEKALNGNCRIKCCACYKGCAKYLSKVNAIFDKILPLIVQRSCSIWLFVLLALGCGGMFVVFVNPRLELPQSREFQVFQQDDPLEVWDVEIKHKFRYFQQSNENAQLTFGLPVFVVWGIKEEDNGSPLNPDDHGVLKYDTTFHISTADEQAWIERFCNSFINSTLVDSNMKNVPCTMSLFKAMMAFPCAHPGLKPCCDQTHFPFPEDVFNECFPKVTHAFLNAANIKSLPTHGQVLYNKTTGVIQGFMLFAIGTQAWSPRLEDMDAYHSKLEGFMTAELQDAPDGVDDGWITSYLKFYDLQRALSSGTYVAIGVSVAVAAVVMLLTSLNLIITIFALLTIVLTIAVTVGALVLLGWELNILESVTISLSVGLSIDFTIHYGVAYRLSSSTKRIEKVQESFQRVGSPVAMAAFTTFIAGAAMMPAKVLAYTQLGVFLMLVMVCSWMYSTFFFQSLCRVLGPKNTDTKALCRTCRRKPSEEDIKVRPNDTWDPDYSPNVVTMSPTLETHEATELKQSPLDSNESDNCTCTTSLSNGGLSLNGHSTIGNGHSTIGNGNSTIGNGHSTIGNRNVPSQTANHIS